MRGAPALSATPIQAMGTGPDAVAATAHSLRSGAASLGLVSLEARSRHLESSAKGADAEEVLAAFDGYRAAFEASSKVLRDAWSELAPDDSDLVSSTSAANT